MAIAKRNSGEQVQGSFVASLPSTQSRIHCSIRGSNQSKQVGSVVHWWTLNNMNHTIALVCITLGFIQFNQQEIIMYTIPWNCDCTKRKMCPECAVGCMCPECLYVRAKDASNALASSVVNETTNKEGK
jgi:hypothetical protein